ncbi:MAG: PQQ-binding-like beta-propeller repeat protein [Planctomyces sp.]|nr:PQQ-binding-like beta-propeller repeat protein [Planctomyces sp.]
MRCLMMMLLMTHSAAAGDWPSWRGLGRNGVVDEPSDWSDGRWTLSDEAWRAEVGEGSSSPVVVGDRLFAFGWRDGQDVLTCLHADTGERLWEQSTPAPRYGRHARGDEGLYAGPCSTPEFDPETGLIHTLSLDGDLIARDVQQAGRIRWRRNLYDDFDAPVRPKVGRSAHRDYGYTSSPLVLSNWLIVEVGAPEGNLMAFDKRTGERVWASRDASSAGHNGGPVPMLVDGVQCVAVHNFAGLLVVRTDDGHVGETVAAVPWVTDFANNIATAAVFQNNVVATSSYNQHRMARFRVTLAGGAETIWDIPQASKVCSPVIVDGHVYWAWNEVACVDFETGAVRWQGGQTGDAGSLIATNDQRLILWSGRGRLSLLDQAGRSPDELRILAERDVFQQADAWPHVVLSNGRLYCKDRTGAIVCIRQPR